jgi:hypothetical protein
VITGVHAIIFSRDPDSVREFFRDVLELRSVDGGNGWPIFALPPAELAVHATTGDDRHELYLMCDDLRATVAALTVKGVEFTSGTTEQPWGLLTTLRMPDGGTLGLYEPRHASPLSTSDPAS